MGALSYRAFQEVNGFSLEMFIRFRHLIYGMKAYGNGGPRTSEGISASLFEVILARPSPVIHCFYRYVSKYQSDGQTQYRYMQSLDLVIQIKETYINSITNTRITNSPNPIW